MVGRGAGKDGGSPPRVRGTANHVTTSTTTDRITPACAGNSRPARQRISLYQDHPRVCGEQWMRPRWASCWAGSPPRVRGTASLFSNVPVMYGITPACAGNSAKYIDKTYYTWDHPRVCGEQITPSPKIPCLTGSPPRVRGTGFALFALRPFYGITPACAGNRSSESANTGKVRDHPRVCGEQIDGVTRTQKKGGSPPRVRGTGGGGS